MTLGYDPDIPKISGPQDRRLEVGFNSPIWRQATASLLSRTVQMSEEQAAAYWASYQTQQEQLLHEEYKPGPGIYL